MTYVCVCVMKQTLLFCHRKFPNFPCFHFHFSRKRWLFYFAKFYPKTKANCSRLHPSMLKIDNSRVRDFHDQDVETPSFEKFRKDVVISLIIVEFAISVYDMPEGMTT